MEEGIRGCCPAGLLPHDSTAADGPHCTAVLLPRGTAKKEEAQGRCPPGLLPLGRQLPHDELLQGRTGDALFEPTETGPVSAGQGGEVCSVGL